MNITAIRAKHRRDKMRDEMDKAGFKPSAGTSVVANHHAMKQAAEQLKKETERGEHKPAVGGYSDHKHGGEC